MTAEGRSYLGQLLVDYGAEEGVEEAGGPAGGRRETGRDELVRALLDDYAAAAGWREGWTAARADEE